MTLEIVGKVVKEEDGTGFANFKMEIFVIGQMLFEEKVGEVFSEISGEFRVSVDDSEFFDKYGPDYGIYLITYNAKNVLLSHGKYDQKGRIKWSAKNLVMFDMSFPASAEHQDPPKFDDLFKDDELLE